MRNGMGAILAGAALAAGGGAWGQDDAGRAAALRRLDSLKISVDFRETGLPAAVDYLREATGLNIVVSPRVAEKEPDLRFTLRVRDLSARAVLRLMLRPRDLAVAWREGALQVVTREELGSGVVLKMYDVRAHLVKVQDFVGPRMELSSPDSANPMGVKVEIDPPPAEPPVNEQLLQELVRANTGRRSWEDNPDASISVANGILVVSQTPAVHREIGLLLAKLQQYR